MSFRYRFSAVSSAALVFVSAPAFADEAESPPAASASVKSAPSAATAPVAEPVASAPSDGFPRVGGHVGFAVPIVTIADPVTAIGADFVSIGLTPGITVKLNERWSIDFEFIAMNELKNTPSATTWIVDPGVIYNAGPFSAGLRVATQVGAPTNIGLVPILVLPVAKLSEKLTYYVEGDLPMFLRDTGREMQPSVGFQLQSGIAF